MDLVFVFFCSFNLLVLCRVINARGLICVDAVLVGVRKSMICVKLLEFSFTC